MTAIVDKHKYPQRLDGLEMLIRLFLIKNDLTQSKLAETLSSIEGFPGIDAVQEYIRCLLNGSVYLSRRCRDPQRDYERLAKTLLVLGIDPSDSYITFVRGQCVTFQYPPVLVFKDGHIACNVQ